MKKTILLVFLVIIGCENSTQPEEGQNNTNVDVVPNFSLPICGNGDGHWELYDYYGEMNDGNEHVILLDIFASWCTICADAAPDTEAIYKEFKNKGLIVVAAGSDLNQPYSCQGWANAFNLSYPILNDDAVDTGPREIFDGEYPITIVIGHDMRVVYKANGRHNDTAIRKAIETALQQMKRS
jgi:thiol-disulfide isomerase/thioredoxin